ncbi:hypothetical protein [Bombella apis]|uniref:hypothetical protein n=1 Tax=Bombella apis TaxID=1785988 RepID=UPI0012B9495C|nr:hypothetical protein [Bombella apis]MPW00087.1 hypothetical protein [Bombella apis]
MARSKVVVVLLLVGLAGCVSPEVKGLCPGYVHYSPEDQLALLGELRSAGAAGQPLPETHRYLRDYGKQRAALRVICKGN